MKIINTVQGSPEWHKHRAQHFNASDAPAMLGVSKYKSRPALLRERATGITVEADTETLARFERGHAAEAAARPIAEKIIGEDLFPTTVTEEVDGLMLSVSLDGMIMTGDIQWEHKLWNGHLAAQIEAKKIDPHYAAQLDQGLMITRAKKVLFMCSDGTEENCAWMWYTPHKTWAKKIVAGWKQFQADLEAYQPVEAEVVPEGRAPEQLPALRIEITGEVTASNLNEFKQTAMSVIGAVSTDLQTDEDFASAEKAVKWCGDVETRLDAAKAHALSQTATIEELFRTLDAIKAEAREKRLNLEKLVKRRKETIRVEIVDEAAKKLQAHYEQINATLVVTLDTTASLVAFRAGATLAMKGKKTVASLRDAVDTALASAKIAANELADLIRVNLQVFDEHKDQAGLFPDLASLVKAKAADDFKAIVTSRIAEHKAAEEKRLEDERARIREEEERKAREKVAEEYEHKTLIETREAAGSGAGERLREVADQADHERLTEAEPTPQPAQEATTEPASQTTRTVWKQVPERPTDAQIVEALAAHFHVDGPTVIEWLSTFSVK